MTRRFLALLVFVSVLAAASFALAKYRYKGWQAGPWEFHKSKDDMSMWLNEEVETGVHGVRVDTVIDVPASDIFPFMTDEKRQASYTFIREFKIIKQYKDWGYLYQRVQSTGIQDRDFTVRLQMIAPATKNGGQYGWVWEQANDKGPPPKDGVVRATVVSGSYILTPLGQNGERTRVSYRLWFDPSSWVPDFLINAAVRNAAFETVHEIREAAVRLKRTGSYDPEPKN